jgi:hypothetical protein
MNIIKKIIYNSILYTIYSYVIFSLLLLKRTKTIITLVEKKMAINRMYFIIILNKFNIWSVLPWGKVQQVHRLHESIIII